MNEPSNLKLKYMNLQIDYTDIIEVQGFVTYYMGCPMLYNNIVAILRSSDLYNDEYENFICLLGPHKHEGYNSATTESIYSFCDKEDAMAFKLKYT